MKKLSVGITIRNDLEMAQIIFGNGLSQNVKFFYDLLRLMGHKPFFLVAQQADKNCMKFRGKDYPAFTFQQVVDGERDIDIAIEAGISIRHETREIFRRLFNVPIVCVRYGHTLMMDMEQICHPETLSPGLYMNKPDVVWASPHFECSASYLETVYSADVKICPYIWEPDFVSGEPFGTSSYLSRPDIWVMEPNISMLKNAVIPMAIIEQAFRANADAFGRATILNGTHFNSRPFFLDNLVKNMQSLESRSEKVFFTQRYSFDQVFKRRDVLLGHQYGCPLNYLYLEAFYKNVPLVHNSPDFKEAGYYYPDFEVYKGRDKLFEAIQDEDVERYGKRSKRLLKKYSINNPEVQQGYDRLLKDALKRREK